MAKVFARVLLNHLQPKKERQLNSQQNGDQCSLVPQLVVHINEVYQNFNNAESDQLFLLYIDFREVSDKVAHNKLIDKLQAFGIIRKL